MKPSEKPIEKIDQFFRDKLDDHAIAPSESAWTRVEAGLSKKNNVVLWRWAAAILLMGALITLIYVSQHGTENTTLPIAQKKIDTKKSTSTKSTVSAPESKTVVSARKNESNKTKNTSTPNTVLPVQLKAEEIQKEETIAVVDEHKQPIVDEINQVKVEEKLQAQATPKIETASSYRKPIKLEFTLEDLPSEETVATTNEVKKTGLKKVLELAREMKQGEGPLISLREKKDELFAHNFIGKKERTQ